MVLQELKKVIRNSTIWFVAVALIVINAVVLCILDNKNCVDDMCDRQLYNETYDYVVQMDEDEAYEYLKNSCDEYMELLINMQLDNAIDMTTYKSILGEVRQCVEYDEYLNNISEMAMQHGSIAIFAQKDSYSDKNIRKTAEEFEKLKGNKLKIGPSRGINLLTDSISIDIIGILLLFYMSFIVFMKDKENGNFKLFKSLKNGREKYVSVKLVIMALLSVATVVMLYGSSFAIAGLRYGYGDTSRLIQSVSGFVSTNLNITVGEYLMWFVLSKIIVYIMLGMVFSMIMNIFNNQSLTYITTVILLGIEAVIYYVTDNNSSVMILKNINIYAFVNTSRFFRAYINLNIFGTPVNYMIVGAVCITMLIAVSIIVSYKMFIAQKGVSVPSGIVKGINRIRTKINIWDRMNTTSFIANELYKILIYRKVLLIGMIAAIFLWWSYKPVVSTYDSVEDVYYRIAVAEVEGVYTDDKSEYIQNKIAENESGADSDSSEWLKAYTKVGEKCQYEQTLAKGYLIYEKGYERLTGKDIESELTLAIEASIMLVLMVVPVWMVEYSTGMNVIINCAARGSRKTGRIKLITAITTAIIIFAGVHIPWYYKILSAYGSEYLDIPAACLGHLSALPEWISIKGFIIMCSIVKILIMAGMVLGIKQISKKNRSYMQVMIFSTGMFVIPWIILRLAKGI